MHRDMKVGLALGVLLVGVVGALFFRREPEKKPVLPALQNGSQIDRQIAERARGPYLTQPEEFADANAAPARGKGDGRSTTTVTAAKPPVTTLTLDDDSRPLPPAGSGASEQSQNGVAAAKTTSPPAPLPGNNQDWESVSGGQPIARRDAAGDTPARNVAATDSTTPLRTHVVEQGETLSGLAGKYLGSTARYREIYDANRDVLRSPDSLTAGLTLKIPAESGRGKSGKRNSPSIAGNGTGTATTRSVSQPKRERVPAVRAASETDASNDAPVAEAPAAPTTPKFTPVRRSPFAAGRNASRPEVPATPAAPADSANEE